MAHAHTHPPDAHALPASEAAALTRTIATASVVVAATLIALKGWAWLASGSVSLLASLADSSLDLIASLFTWFAVRYAAAPPDAEHRFGHGKAEAVAAMFQAGLVAITAALIAIEAFSRAIAPQPIHSGEIAIGVMLVSIALTGALVAGQTWALKRTGSIATAGDRAHYLTDFAGNAAAIAGVAAGAFLGWAWADAAFGFLIAAWLGWGAYGVARAAANQLLDRELPDQERARIRTLALADPRVRAVHDLRTRSSGPFVHIQFHADLDPAISLQEAHEIVVAAEERIRAIYARADIIIHPDPADASAPHGHELFGESRAASAP